MTKDRLNNAVKAAKEETREAMQTMYDALNQGQQKKIDELHEINPDVFYSINKWNRENFKLTPKEQAFVAQVAFRLQRKLSITYKQAKWALEIKDKAESMGWKEGQK